MYLKLKTALVLKLKHTLYPGTWSDITMFGPSDEIHFFMNFIIWWSDKLMLEQSLNKLTDYRFKKKYFETFVDQYQNRYLENF